MSDASPSGITRRGTAHFKEPFLHKYILLWICMRTYRTAWFYRAPDTLKLSDPGPPPTCPFISTNNVKERKRPTHRPSPFSRGDPCACFSVTAATEPVWLSAAVRGHIWGAA